jgi:hypothetical protein
MDYLIKFNEVFQDMVRDLVNVFPTDSELRLYEFGLKATFIADKFMVSRIFNENVAIPYGDVIKQRDEGFFVSKTYDEYKQYQDVGDIISKLKRCWVELSEDNKGIVWKYLIVLINLNQKVYS